MVMSLAEKWCRCLMAPGKPSRGGHSLSGHFASVGDMTRPQQSHLGKKWAIRKFHHIISQIVDEIWVYFAFLLNTNIRIARTTLAWKVDISLPP